MSLVEHTPNYEFTTIIFDQSSTSNTPPKTNTTPSFPTQPKRVEDHVKTPGGKTKYPKKAPPGQGKLWPTRTQ